MRTETMKIYQFNELSDKAKETAIEKQRSNEGYLDYEWFDYLHQDFIEELNTIGVNCEGFYWDVHSSREFTAEGLVTSDEQLLLKSAGLTKWLIINELRGSKTEIYDIGFDEYGETNVELDTEIGLNSEELSDEEYSDREKEITDMEEKITEFIKEKFEKFWKTLEKDYDYLMSDEGITEHLEMNEFEFTEEGERW